VEGREVDFVQLADRRPIRFVETKLSETRVDRSLVYLRRKFPSVNALQVVATPGIDRLGELGIRVVSADRFLEELLV
jgi:hypothetical protein